MKLNLKNILFFVFVFILFWRLPLDPDLGWHLRYGQQIFENGQVFRDNRIGYFLTDYQWTLNYGLYQLAVFVLEKYVGLWSLSALFSILLTLMLAVIKKVFKLNLMTSLVMIVYFWLISIPVMTIGLRPQAISTIFLMLTYVVLMKRKWLLLLPLSWLWANTHGAFILELVVMSVYFGQLLIKKDKDLLKFGLIGVSVVAVSLINPFGVGIYQEAFRHSWYPLNRLIAEWVAPAGLSLVMVLATVSLMVVLTTYFFYLDKSRLAKKKDWLFWLVNWLLFLALALKARRNLSLFGVVSIFVFLELVKLKLKDGWWSYVVVGGLVGLVVVKGGVLDGGLIDWSLVEDRRNYPVGAVEFLADSHQCQNIYNTYEWGGYLLWKLPEKRFFVDGRMTVWDNPENKSPYTIYLEIIQARLGWSDRLLAHGTDCLLISRGTFLDLELRKDNNQWQDVWFKLYEDDGSVIYGFKKVVD